MTTAKLPTSKAKTAYGLLSEVCALILAEPKRYNQERYIVRADGGERAPRGFPECGTVGCVAGWVATLKGPRNLDYSVIHSVAADRLGLFPDQAFALFRGAALDSKKTRTSPPPQTKAHARAGVAHIHRFQKKYRAQLLAKKV